jgi:hypothetical protein
MYILAPEPISTGYFKNPSHQSVSVCASLLSLLDNSLVKMFICKYVCENEEGTNMDTAKGKYTEQRESFILKQTHFSVNNNMKQHGNILA